MRKITDFIIDKRYYILTLFVILTVVCAILSQKVTINYDIAKYLPDTSNTRIGMDIMEEEFAGLDTSNLNVMFENLDSSEKFSIKEYLEDIEGVSSVDYDDSEKYNKDNYTLYVVTVDAKSDSKVAANIYNDIIEHYADYTLYTSGSVSDTNEPILPIWIIVLAVLSALVILIIMCDSYIEPFLFLTAILMAVVLNNGTNIIFDSVSNVTSSICAILQLALSMDYSIMLMNRYNQEKEKQSDKIKAMKNALHHAFQAISSSSVTTIVGLLALVFMSFTIGRDLGFVLAKGVLFSLICIFFVLPVFILMFDKLITKTHKKSPIITLNKIGSISYKLRFLALILFIGVCVGSCILKGNLGFDYTSSEEDEISKVFTENNQMAIIYKNSDEDKMAKHLKEFENIKKVDEVLGYGNTIDESLTYDKLNLKLKDLGSNVDVEDYLLKIVYYNYYNPNNNVKMTFDEFVNFIENEAYKNEKINQKIDAITKSNITRLKNFTSIEQMNEEKSAYDIAQILEIDESSVKDLFVYYLSINDNIKISLNDFLDFMFNYILTNPDYANSLDAASIEKLNLLRKFANYDTINQQMTSEEIANLFGIDYNTIKSLYTYYISINDIDLKLTLNEFANFVLNDVLNNERYAENFTDEMISNIKLLATYSNLEFIQKQMTSQELADLFSIDDIKIKQLLLLYYSNIETNNKLSISEFFNKTIYLKDNTNYLDSADITMIRKLNKLTNKELVTMKMDESNLKLIFDTLSKGLVDMVYANAKILDDTLMTPMEFVDLTIKTLSSVENVDTELINSLKLLKLIMNDAVNDNQNLYTSSELASILNMDKNLTIKLYSLIDYINGNTSNWTMSPNEFVTLILKNSDNESIKNNLDENTLNNLKLLSKIMESSINQVSYSYFELSQFINVDENTTKSIYALIVSNQNNLKFTPLEFVNFLLTHSNDNVLKNSISNEMLSNLNLINNIMNSVINNIKYNSVELSNFLSIDKNTLDLLYGLYNSKYLNTNLCLSLKDFVNFILDDVITNPKYAENFDEDKTIKLRTIKEVMDSVISSNFYTNEEIYNILTVLSNNLDKNMIDVLYIYYGSIKEYNESWNLTVQEFVNYLNENILKDQRFNDFIDDEMKNEIIDAKATIKDAKELLLGNNYSRVVLNTNFALENAETFEFVQNIDDTLSQDMKDFYIIGDSPMAYDLSQTFNGELNYITVITMIVIFIVVAITFKSLIIPIILVLTIQCAVYLTMGILSFSGENVYFIAILIVQSILMGATIDYAILYTSYYVEHRKKMGIKESIVNAYNNSIHTILTSASILIIVTLIVGHFSSAIASKICTTISKGTLCSSLLILILLPAVIASFDKIIIKKKKN